MKQFFLLIAIITISSSVRAQLNKGQWLLGGDAGFTSMNYKSGDAQEALDEKIRSFSIYPRAGFFIADKLCIGLKVNISHSSDVYNYSDAPQINIGSDKSTTWGISPFVRYYFLPKAGKINLLADAGYGYVRVRDLSESNGNASTDKYSKGIFTIGAGPAFILNPHIALEILAEYSTDKTLGINENSILINAGFQIHLGK